MVVAVVVVVVVVLVVVDVSDDTIAGILVDLFPALSVEELPTDVSREDFVVVEEDAGVCRNVASGSTSS